MNPDKLMGRESPADQKVSMRVGDWNAMKLALWRSRVALEIAAKEAEEIVARCTHAKGCPGVESETETCLPICGDREIRMSALVVLNAARQLAPVDARPLAAQPYYAPSREYFSEVIATFATMQAEVELLREIVRKAGIEVPAPHPTALPHNSAPQLQEENAS